MYTFVLHLHFCKAKMLSASGGGGSTPGRTPLGLRPQTPVIALGSRSGSALAMSPLLRRRLRLCHCHLLRFLYYCDETV